MLKTLGIITARGGSKGIPRKNIRDCNSVPLIAHTIKAANGSRLTDCIVSTDDNEIAEISKKYGGKVPFLRPAELANDSTPTLPVIIHALGKYEQITGQKFDYVMILQPTSPLRTSEDINKAIEIADEKKPESLVSLVQLTDLPLDKLKNFENGLVQPAIAEEKEGVRRQDRKMLYRRNGAIYLTRRDILLEKKRVFGDEIMGFLMPEERSVDINSELDLAFAEFLMKKHGSEQSNS